MAKKGKNQQKQAVSKHVTTRRVARWQREKRRQRITFLSGVVIIVAVLGIIVGGFVATRSSDWLSKVETDSGTVAIKKADYADELKLLFAVGAYNSSTITSEAPLINIERNILIEDSAKSFGLTVSDAEVTDTIRSMFQTDNESITDTNFQEQYQDMINNMGLSDQEFRKFVKGDLLKQDLLLYYIDQIPESGEQVAAETFFLSNESNAYEVTQLWRDGNDFETLAEMYSNTGSSGWLIKGFMEEEFDSVAFSIEIGNISDPFPYGTGYYVIKVLDRKDGPIDETLRQQSGSAELDKWFYQAYADKVERNLKLDLAEVYAWAVEQLQ
ncbi:MAG: peptidylprolyl isomerase [Dehalococcoidia bacterium]